MPKQHSNFFKSSGPSIDPALKTKMKETSPSAISIETAHPVVETKDKTPPLKSIEQTYSVKLYNFLDVDFFQHTLAQFLDLRDLCVFFKETSKQIAKSETVKNHFNKWLKELLLPSLHLTGSNVMPFFFAYTRSCSFRWIPSPTGAEQKQQQFKVAPYMPVKEMIAGGHFFLARTRNDKVLGLGINTYGQLGIGPQKRCLGEAIPSLSDKNIVQMASGSSHTLFLTATGTVLVCGKNNNRQLGLGDSERRNVPVTLSGVSGRLIAAGPEQSFVVTTDGKLLAYGANFSGEIHLSETPSLNATDPDIVVQHIAAAGFNHYLVQTSDGRVFSFGENDNGQLGFGDTKERNKPEVLPKIRARHIATGFHHSLILTTEGQVLGFGSNAEGQLGLGEMKDQFSPKALKIPGKVITITANATYSLFVTRYKEKIQLFGCGQLTALNLNSSQITFLGDLPTALLAAPVLDKTTLNVPVGEPSL